MRNVGHPALPMKPFHVSSGKPSRRYECNWNHSGASLHSQPQFRCILQLSTQHGAFVALS